MPSLSSGPLYWKGVRFLLRPLLRGEAKTTKQEEKEDRGGETSNNQGEKLVLGGMIVVVRLAFNLV